MIAFHVCARVLADCPRFFLDDSLPCPFALVSTTLLTTATIGRLAWGHKLCDYARPALSYAHSGILIESPAEHFVNWQQDPHANYAARYVFPKPVRELRVEVDLVCDMTVINPFDFFIEEYAQNFPFRYESELARDLRPYLELLPTEPVFNQFMAGLDCSPRQVAALLVELNQHLQSEISYLIRLEPGVQTPAETLTKRAGSCRDSAWLLVQVLRQLGLAARFVSGYLIQLAPDIRPLEGPGGPTEDFTDLHAWAEVFLPGAGWVGLDPTSGLLAGEGHIRWPPPRIPVQPHRSREPWKAVKWNLISPCRLRGFMSNPESPAPTRRHNGSRSTPWGAQSTSGYGTMTSA